MDKTLSPDKRADLLIAADDARREDPTGARHRLGRSAAGRADSAGIERRRRLRARASIAWAFPPSTWRIPPWACAWPRSRAAMPRCSPPRSARRPVSIPKRPICTVRSSAASCATRAYNMSIGGGVDLIREPRNGRNFEYAGEDPILAGTMVGQLMKGLQAQQVMGDIKHYAFNDQETGRNILNVILDKRAMRETDLLAFQIAHEDRAAGGRDVLLQQGQRRLCLRERLSAEPGAEEGVGLPGLGAFGLGRHALHHQGRLERARPGDARRPFLRRAAEESGGQPRGARGAAERHGAPHSAQHVRVRRDRQSAGTQRGGSVPGAGGCAAHRGRVHRAAEERGRPAAAECGARGIHCADRIACRCGRALRRRFGAGGSAGRRCGQRIRREARRGCIRSGSRRRR